MQIVFYASLIYFTSVLHGNSDKKILKPSFNPYCTTRDKCRPVCTCEVFPNCMILPMDETIRSSILYYHNQIRDIETMAEPQPAGMTFLEYDLELEEISICWAARCEDDYSECFLTSRFSETSQSVVQLTLEGGQQPNVFLWMQVMNDWLDQVRTLSAETIQSLPAGEEGEKLHNYVQLMSDRILAVGCAWSLRDNVLTLVCTYGPRSPLQGESIFKSGNPCSLCPGGYACDYKEPFERLCKLKIYSVFSVSTDESVFGVTTEESPQFDTPPPLPPLPSLPEDESDDYFPPQPQIPALPSPPKLPDYPAIYEQPAYPQPRSPSYPQLPSPPNPPIPPPSSVPDREFLTEATKTSSATYDNPKQRSAEDSSEEIEIDFSLFSLAFILHRLL